jgi:hypothetical protein
MHRSSIDRSRSRQGAARNTMLSMLCVALFAPRVAGTQQSFDRARDRGTGVPISMFGTYVNRGELIIYPFFEYYRDSDAEYSPNEFGFGIDVDFRGRYRASEGLIFVGYGISDRLAVEIEGAIINARLEKASADTSAMPALIEESGLGDVEGQLRWRWSRETDRRPELFSYFETVFPLQKNRVLIGTQAWEFKLGTGLVRGFRWGTMTLRAAVEYDGAERSAALGEYALEYLKRISPAFLVFAGVEGSEDEVEGITELQLSLRQNVVLKLNNAIGLTSKAADWAPEIGVMFRFR